MKKDEIQNLVKELIEQTTVPVKGVSIVEEEANDGTKSVCFSVEVANPHLFINRGGEALFALNHLVRKIVESKIKTEENMPESKILSKILGFDILVDINNFQKQRKESVRAVAHMMAERARYFKASVEVDPMSAYERRIVHEYLSDQIDVKTESTGDGLNRRVVIKYVGNI